jgi:hypothetical protein
MKMFRKFIIPLSLVGLLVACGPTTKLEKSWADPSLTASTIKAFTKILVVAPLKDEASKRIAEDKIAAQLKTGVAVQSYSYLLATDTDQKLVEEKLKKDGFDGVILMRLKDVEKTTSYTPGTSYGGWYGYRYASPGYVSTDKTFIVETNFYSLASGKLLWSGTTSTLNPTTLDQSLDGIISTLKYELQRRGLVK